jgi:hypothetical protein
MHVPSPLMWPMAGADFAVAHDFLDRWLARLLRLGLLRTETAISAPLN